MQTSDAKPPDAGADLGGAVVAYFVDPTAGRASEAEAAGGAADAETAGGAAETAGGAAGGETGETGETGGAAVDEVTFIYHHEYFLPQELWHHILSFAF
jgi:hypothetical protein